MNFDTNCFSGSSSLNVFVIHDSLVLLAYFVIL